MMDFKECQEWGKRRRDEKENLRKRQEQIRKDELKKMGIDPNNQPSIKPKYDHPSMPEDGFITVLYVVGMIASMIFNDFWIAWIALTILYGNFISRHDND